MKKLEDIKVKGHNVKLVDPLLTHEAVVECKNIEDYREVSDYFQKVIESPRSNIARSFKPRPEDMFHGITYLGFMINDLYVEDKRDSGEATHYQFPLMPKGKPVPEIIYYILGDKTGKLPSYIKSSKKIDPLSICHACHSEKGDKVGVVVGPVSGSLPYSEIYSLENYSLKERLGNEI